MNLARGLWSENPKSKLALVRLAAQTKEIVPHYFQLNRALRPLLMGPRFSQRPTCANFLAKF